MTDEDRAAVDVAALLESAGFDPDANVLTRRQAEVFALRERGLAQAAIADRLGTSRANVSSVEASARENVAKARATVEFVETLRAPVRVTVDPGTDLYDVPARIFDACDAAGIKVNYTAPELMTHVAEAASTAIEGRHVEGRLSISVTEDGEVSVRTPAADE